MKLVILAGKHVYGGAEHLARMLARALDTRHQVHLITTGPCDQELVEGNHRRIMLRLPSRPYFWHNYWNGSVVRRLRRHLEHIGPELVHFHNVHNRTLSAWSLLLSNRYPTVWTLHDLWSQCVWSWHRPRPLVCRYSAYGCVGCRNMPVLSMVDRKIKEAVFRRSPLHLVVPCEWLRQRIASGPLAGKPVEVIHNGVDPGPFEAADGGAVRKKFGIPQVARVVLFAGHMLTNVKGHEDLLGISPRVLATERDVWFLFAGPHGEKRTPHPQVLFAGRVEASEMPGYYAAADVFAYPTHADIFPLVVAEAMASGLPVVTHRLAGIPEIVEDGVSGFVVDEGGRRFVRRKAETAPWGRAAGAAHGGGGPRTRPPSLHRPRARPENRGTV